MGPSVCALSAACRACCCPCGVSGASTSRASLIGLRSRTSGMPPINEPSSTGAAREPPDDDAPANFNLVCPFGGNAT